MVTVSYAISDTLKKHLENIQAFRTKILTAPLSYKSRLRLSFETQASKIYYSFDLSNAHIERGELVRSLVGHQHKPTNTRVSKFHQGLTLIQKKWNAEKSPLTPSDCVELFKISCTGTIQNDETERELKHILNYVQLSNEYPIVQAALIFILLRKQRPFSENNDLFSFLLFDLFLNKSGFDIQNFFAIAHYLSDKREEFEKELAIAIQNENLNRWLEFIAECFEKQLAFVLDVIKIDGSLFRTGISKSFWKLTERQKQVVSLSDLPDTQITNRKVQALHGVSQITASRDLSKLSTLGIFFQNGHGRSVYYTRF